MVDTFPVVVLQPLDSEMSHMLYNPKYGATVVKFTLATDFMERFIFESGTFELFRFIHISGPHLGLSYDGHIFPDDLLEWWEFFLGDGHYIGKRGFMTPFRHPPNGLLSDEEYEWNAIVAHYRSRVEHANRRVKSHAIFQTPWRGSIGLLACLVKIVIHMQAIEQNMHLMYHPYGNWPHNPE